MSWWVPQVVGTLVSTQKAQLQKVEKVRYGKGLIGPHAEIAALRAWRQREAEHAEHLELLRSFALLALLHRTCRASYSFPMRKKVWIIFPLRQALGHFRGSFRFAY